MQFQRSSITLSNIEAPRLVEVERFMFFFLDNLCVVMHEHSEANGGLDMILLTFTLYTSVTL